ncbi:hypothetical protein OAN307_c19670 [Octadecabacter antarcticus 307]|uniref:Uncharacterized protein n=1 Tax=Octadecabacter antarcticus 307 TaxID=391626 RepID=M9RCR4_9RHOB|nr:hypothetical protein OAN307_c19670 [Octadecabacter antarcticus 307]
MLKDWPFHNNNKNPNYHYRNFAPVARNGMRIPPVRERLGKDPKHLKITR